MRTIAVFVMSAATALAADAGVQSAGPAGAAGSAVAQADKDAKTKKDGKPKKTKEEKAASKAAKAAAKANRVAPDAASDSDQVVTDQPGKGARAQWKQHPSIRFGNVFRLDFQAKIQEDGHHSGYADSQLQDWELHRNRYGIQGKLFKDVEFEVEREFKERELTEKEILEERTPASPWKDVNVNLAFIKNAQVQIGKFKIPFGLDQLTGVTHNDFVYRSLGANYLSPARDIGIQAHGRFFKRGLNYWAGVFQHDGDNARSKKIQGGDETLAARVTGTPFRHAGIPGLEIGTAFSYSKLTDDSFRPNGLRGRTVVTQDTFYDPVYVKGHRRRWEADADWTLGGATVRGEYTIVSDDRFGQGLADDDLPSARAQSWYVAGTYIVTGDAKERPLRPDRELFAGGFGAVEVVGRFERLWFDSTSPFGVDQAYRSPRAETILPSGEKALTLGINWTLNRWIKLQVNAIREHVEDSDRNPVSNGAAFWSRVLRLQFVL